MSMFEFLARTIVQRRWSFIIAGLAVLLIGATYGVNVIGQLKDGGLDDPASASSQEARMADRAFPNARISMIVLFRHPTWTVGQPEYRAAAAQIIEALKKDPATQSVLSYYETQDAHFVSRDAHETYLAISLRGNDQAQSEAYRRFRKQIPKTALQVRFGGPAVANDEVNQQVALDIPRAGKISLPILAILLVLIFRSAIAAALPLIIGALSVLGAFALTRLLTSFLDISVFAVNIISLLGLGLAIDYSLLFVSRFRDELAAGKSVAGCLERTIRTAGESIFFSGSTVTLSLLGMLAFPENFLRSMGIGGALAVIVAMIASLTVLPAILAIIGPWVNRGAIPLPRRRREPQTTEQGFWFAFSHFVMRHAVPVIAITLALLIAMGIPFLHVRFTNPGAESLPNTFQSRITDDAMTRDFASGQSAPIQILIQMPGSPVTLAQLTGLSTYVTRLKRLPGVRTIDSLVTLDPHIPLAGYALFYALPFSDAVAAAKSHYVSGNSTLISVDYAGNSQDDAAQNLVAAIRAVPPPTGAHLLVGGDTAQIVDHLASLRAHLPAAASTIFIATFILLFLMLSSLIVPAKAILLNILSLSASFGLMAWIFQEGHLQNILDFTSSHSIDATLPVLIFALAFGLSTDYEVFLVSRIQEEYARTGDNTEAIALGVEKTGQIITSAALLLIVVVAAFGASKILSMKEIGVGLAIAVAIDAAIVRTLLVPATMRVFGELNWWLPKAWRRPRLYPSD